MNNPTQTHSDDQQACRPGKFDMLIQQVQEEIIGKEIAIECENAVLDALAIHYKAWEVFREDASAKACAENRSDIPQSPSELLRRVRQRLDSMNAVKQWNKELVMLRAALELFVKYNEPV